METRESYQYIRWLGILLSALLVAGCCTPEQFNNAVKACEPFGGLETYWVPVAGISTGFEQANCVNGEIISGFGS